MKRRAKHLRLIGVIILALGVAMAGAVFWQGNRNRDLSGDPAMQGYNRAERQQMGLLFGKSGLWIDDFSDDLKQPGTQAVLITGASVLTASLCFYFARLLEVDDEAGGGKSG